jgi:hypothetical protein
MNLIGVRRPTPPTRRYALWHLTASAGLNGFGNRIWALRGRQLLRDAVSVGVLVLIGPFLRLLDAGKWPND